jgi:DNA-binding response OmpR family regulator
MLGEIFYADCQLKILIIEDNPTIARQLGEFLSAHRWQVDFAQNAGLGIQLALEQIYDVVLLDLHLPDMDGLLVCEQIKSRASVVPPILMLTARDSFEDKAAGFHCGADDYLTKPFDLRELVLRCEALSRRHNLHQPKSMHLGDLLLDTKNKIAWHRSEKLELTSIGFQILEVLVKSYPNVCLRSLLIHQLWGDNPPESDALKSHIYALRKCLDKSFAKPMIKTLMNLGYKLEFPGEKVD